MPIIYGQFITRLVKSSGHIQPVVVNQKIIKQWPRSTVLVDDSRRLHFPRYGNPYQPTNIMQRQRDLKTAELKVYQ